MTGSVALEVSPSNYNVAEQSPELNQHLQDWNASPVEFYDEGCHNLIYRCQAAVEDRDSPIDCVLRVPKCQAAARRLEADYELRQHYELESLGAPRALRIGRLPSGTPVMLEAFVVGEHKGFNELTNPEIEKFAQAVRRIHDHTASGRFSNHSGEPPTRTGTNADYVRAMVAESVSDRLLAVDIAAFEGAGTLIKAGQRRLDGMLAAHARILAGSDFRLLHHDLNPDNVLWTPGGDIAFLDWNVTIGDPADDLDYVITNNGCSQTFRQKFLAAYTADDCNELFARMEVYELKNRLDDLVWSMVKCGEPSSKIDYTGMYRQRFGALQNLLAVEKTLARVSV